MTVPHRSDRGRRQPVERDLFMGAGSGGEGLGVFIADRVGQPRAGGEARRRVDGTSPVKVEHGRREHSIQSGPTHLRVTRVDVAIDQPRHVGARFGRDFVVSTSDELREHSADLGLGQPAEHAIRSCLVALRFGDEIGLGPDDRATTYWVNLLAWIGCTADSHELAKLFGDDIALRAASYEVDLAGVSQVGFLLRHAAAGESVLKRILAASTLLASSGAKVEQALTAHCEVTGRLATRLGLGQQVAEALAYAFAGGTARGCLAASGSATSRCRPGCCTLLTSS